MVKRKSTKEQTMIYKILRTVKIEQHEPPTLSKKEKNTEVNADAPDW
jgi:hypothetical protein